MDLEELRVYQRAMELGEDIWNTTEGWDFFSKDTVGKQLVKSTDSIAANLSESFGRYHYLDKKKFCYYSRGSLFETKSWITKAKNRNLITEKECISKLKEIDTLGKMLNSYIKSIGSKGDSFNEPGQYYIPDNHYADNPNDQ